MKVVIVSDRPLTLKREDSGCALIGEIEGSVEVGGNVVHTEDDEDGVFVRLHSWSDCPEGAGAHHTILGFLGKRVKVTIETVED